jgi:Bacterial Ig domain
VLAKPTVTFSRPSVVNGPIAGEPAAKVTIDDRGIGIDRIAWTVNGTAASSGNDPELHLQTARDQDGGYANGVELTIGATVTDYGRFKTTVSRKGIVANPYVRLVAPSADAVIGGPFAWSATAAGAGGRTVASVQLLVDGDPVGAPDTTSPYGGTFDPKLAASAGEVILSLGARVTDSAGITRDTPWRAVTRVAPTLTWRSPSDYADEFSPFFGQVGTTARFRVDADTFAPGGISRVLFRVDGTTVSTDYSAPYTFDYVVPAAGQTHRISARAVDATGVYATSEDLLVKATAPHAATAFTQPASDGQILSGTATFGLSGASGYDGVCLYVDTAYAGCLDPASQTSLDVDLTAFTPGVHSAHWQLSWYDASFDYHEVRGPSRSFVIGGSSPTISITQLTPGLKVTGKKTVGAIVSGVPAGVYVQEVDFFAGTQEIGSDGSPAFYVTWDTKSAVDGPHTVRVVALLSDGSRIRATVDVATSNFTGKLTSPSAGATVSGTVTLGATATADLETIAEAATFLLDGVVIARDRSGPFSVAWDSHGAADGSHGLTVKIQLNDGRTATTPAQTITVDNVP